MAKERDGARGQAGEKGAAAESVETHYAKVELEIPAASGYGWSRVKGGNQED